MTHRPGRLVDIGDTALFTVDVGDVGAYPLLIFHGGPGDDHHEFGDYLDPLANRGYRLVFVDERGQGRSGPSSPSTWTLPKIAADVPTLARALGLDRWAALGHSFGAFVVLQAAVDFPGTTSQTIVSSGLPSAKYLDQVEKNLARFEPESLRAQVAASWEREADVRTEEEFARLMREQMPFHFADPMDPRIEDYFRRSAEAKYAPDVLRAFAAADYGAIEVEDRLGEVDHPVLVLAGRHDRACSVAGAEAMARGIPGAELVIFERSGHMTFVEETEAYLAAVDGFLRRHR